MPLAPFGDPEGNVDWCAAVEQMALNYGIYFEGVKWVLDVVERAYGFATTVVARRDEPAAFFDGMDDLPRYVAFTQLGDPRLHVVIMGTREVFQWVQNFWSQGSNAITTGNCPLGHRSWNAIGDGLLEKIRPWLLENPTGEVNISGHSLGGVSAWTLGVKIRNAVAFSGVRVNVLTFGSPRQSIGPFDGPNCPVPHFMTNVQTKDDIVTVLPTNVIGVGPQWQQNGPVKVVLEDGALGPDDANATFNYLPLTQSRFTRHYPGTYLNYLLRRYEEELICPDSTLPLLVACNLQSAPPPVAPPVIPSPPKAIDGYSVDETVTASEPFFFIGGPMSVMRVSIFFNWGGKKFQEEYYIDGEFDPQPNGLSATGKLSKSLNLIKARAALLAAAAATAADGESRAIPVGYRMSQVNEPLNRSKPYITPDSIQSVHASGTADRDNLMFLRAFTANGARRTVRLKGTPKEWIPPDPNRRLGQIPAGAASAVKAFADRLVGDGWGALTQTLSNPRAISSITTLAAAIPEAPAGAWVLKASGSYTVNQKIYVKGARGLGLRGFGGEYRIVAIQSDGSLVLSESKCDPCPLKVTSLGQIFDQTFGLSVFTSVTFAGWGNGKLSNGNFFSEAGRRPACCRP